MSTYTDRHGYLRRYFIRWKTRVHADNGLQVIGWEVCDRRKFDNIAVFEHEDRVACEKVKQILNEGEDDGVSK